MITHPIYDTKVESWEKFRLTYTGGKEFVEAYVIQRPSEPDPEYITRKKLSHCPAHAKSTLNEIKNSIFSRLAQGVTRNNGSLTYNAAIRGEAGGVDREHSSMTSFIGTKILPDLLPIGKVGIWVDTPEGGGQPYFVTYKAEDIMSWEEDFDNPGHFSKLLLRRHIYKADDTYGFPKEEVHEYRIIVKTPLGIQVTDIDEDEETILRTYQLDLDSIPFVVAELSESLLQDVADYQISLANLDSGDIAYCWFGNVPLYTEQIDRNNEFDALMNQVTNEEDKNLSADDPVLEGHGVELAAHKIGAQRRTGATVGVGYGKGLDRPGFISPPPDPLEISMKKQEAMRDDIRTLINLSLTTIKPRAASAESKMLDERGLEAGLSSIGLELQSLENRLAELWAMYEETDPASVNYPEEYQLKDDQVRRLEAQDLIKLKENFPSQKGKTFILKQAAEVLMAGKITTDELEEIFREIEEASGCTGDAEHISRDLENGLVSAVTASKLRGYGSKEVGIAQKEKAERVALAREAQRGDEDFTGAQVRGDGKDEKDFDSTVAPE